MGALVLSTTLAVLLLAVVEAQLRLPMQKAQRPSLDLLPVWARGGKLAADKFAEQGPHCSVARGCTEYDLQVPYDWEAALHQAGAVSGEDLLQVADSAADTFPIRFWVDYSCYKDNGPIFVSMGGEGGRSGVSCSDYAKQYGALMVGVEHRFYGGSVPPGGLTVDNLRYLDVQQNLHDTAAVVQYVQANLMPTRARSTDDDGGDASTVVAFGGSYSGATCAWFRQAFPHLVTGCISESGVINAILDFTAFDVQVKTALEMPGFPGTAMNCSGRLIESTRALERQLAMGNITDIKRFFGASNLIDTPQGDPDFFYMIADGPAMMVQYGSKAELCDGLAQIDADSDDWTRISNLNDIIVAHYGTGFASGCFYDSDCIRSAARTGGPGSNMADGDSRSWRWQKCTQTAYLQAAPAEESVRGAILTLDALVEQCQYIFGADIVPDTSTLNIPFGGARPDLVNTSNIVYLDYSDDPWKEASLQAQYTPALPLCITECDGCGHCGAGAPSALTECHDLAMSFVGEWVEPSSSG